MILSDSKIFRADKKLNGRYINSIKFKKTDLFNKILEVTSFLPAEVQISERLYYIIHNITSHIKCNCGNDAVFINQNSGYRTYCSKKCSNSSASSKKKAKETKLKRYGNENYNNRSKAKETNIEKYGVEHVLQDNSIFNKSKQTKLERYGNENYNNMPQNCKTKLERYGNEFYTNREKDNKTNLERYKVNFFTESNIFKQKSKETKLERYGNEFYTNREKANKTNLERYNSPSFLMSDAYFNKSFELYGVKYPIQSYEIQHKSKITCSKKYERDYHNQKHILKESLEKLNNKEWLIEQHYTEKKPLRQIASELTVDSTTVSNYFRRHDIVVKYYNSSYPEKQLVQHIEYIYNTKVITNTRKIIGPKEIDIYLPEYNLAIEYNGIYWHRPDLYNSKEDWLEYHQMKVNECNKKNIHLLHLWENYGNHYDLIHNAINNIIDNNLEKILKEIYKC